MGSLISCRESQINKNVEKDISGNWQLKYCENELHAENNELDIGIYQELYINDEAIFIYTLAGLTYIVDYEIEDDMSLNTNYTNLPKGTKIKVSDNRLFFNFPDLNRVIYEKIEKGILPKVFMEDEDFLECYYKSFYMREEKYLKSEIKSGDNL